MEYFAVQVWTGHEDDYAGRLAAAPGFRLDGVAVPKRALVLRRRGKNFREDRPIFPGYVFVASEDGELDPERRWYMKSTNFFLRILPDSSHPKPIGQRDRAVLTHFMSFGKRADISKVLFNEQDRIVVLEGPLKGLEGCIVKVDRRKRRAKVRLDMCENSFLIDLSFETMERPAKGTEAGDAKS